MSPWSQDRLQSLWSWGIPQGKNTKQTKGGTRIYHSWSISCLHQKHIESEIGSQPTMCQDRTGSYVSLLAPGKTDFIPLATQERLPPRIYFTYEYLVPGGFDFILLSMIGYGCWVWRTACCIFASSFSSSGVVSNVHLLCLLWVGFGESRLPSPLVLNIIFSVFAAYYIPGTAVLSSTITFLLFFQQKLKLKKLKIYLLYHTFFIFYIIRSTIYRVLGIRYPGM